MQSGALWFFILCHALFVNTLMLELRSSQTNTHLLQLDQYQIYCQQSQVFPYTPKDSQRSAVANILEQAKNSSIFSKLSEV